jgi:hypothetical protein
MNSLVETDITLNEEQGPDSLCLDQIVVPKIQEVVPQTIRKMVLPSTVDRN